MAISGIAKASVAKNSLSASEQAPKGPFLPSSRGPRKEIAQLQQSFALLAVRRKFLEFYCDLFLSCPLTPGFSKPDVALPAPWRWRMELDRRSN
jgi:hypothetical protein